MILAINMLLILLIRLKNMKRTTFLIAGKHAVTEALKNSKCKVLRVFLTEDSKKKLTKTVQILTFLEILKFITKQKKN